MSHAAVLVTVLLLGFASTAEAQGTYGFLRSGATVGLGVVLEHGIEYLIAGVCDQDCTDLDLALTDGVETLVTDELDDDAPVLEFTAPVEGFHYLEITMYACSIEPCSFAFQVYRR